MVRMPANKYRSHDNTRESSFITPNIMTDSLKYCISLLGKKNHMASKYHPTEENVLQQSDTALYL